MLEISQDIPANTLIGGETAVEVTVTNTGEDTAFNLALLVRLPVGVSVPSSDQPPSDVVTETDAAATPTGTVVAWENIVDIRPGGVFRFRYSLAHDLAVWSVGDTFLAPVAGYVSEEDATRPSVAPSGTTPPVTAVVSNFTQTGGADGETTLVPLLPTKSEPSIEGELLRGVHEHQTVYTLEARTGSAGGVEISILEDWIPAGIEFLGCGTEDNSDVATEEYPGSGPLNPGNAPPIPPDRPCFDPVIVETVDTDLPEGLEPGVYTHVVWEIGETLPPDSTVGVSYVAGIPQRQNTMAWPDDAVPSPGSGEQGSNLDNNSGPVTTQVGEGTTWTNLASADTTFAGEPITVQDTETVQAVDVSVHKFVDTPTIQQGAVATWRLLVESSEYVVDGGVAGLTLVDVTPDGTCPIGSVHPGCTTVTEPAPSTPYTATSFDASTGETTLTWELPDVTLGRSDVFELSFSTQTLENYVAPPGGPVSTNDSWTNTVTLAADATTFEEEGPAGATVTNGVDDTSAREQSGTPVGFAKDVGLPVPGQPCGTGRLVRWSPSDAVAGPGDRVCFRLTVRPPDSLDTLEATLVDFLPAGFRYEPGSATPGPDNEVDPDTVSGPAVSGSPATGQRLQWTLIPPTVLQPAQVAQTVFSAVLDGGVPPELGASGDSIVNSARVSYENSNGEIFVDFDTGTVVLSEAHLGLTKGIIGAGSRTFEPPADPVGNVLGGDAVTYAIDVTNDGTRDAFGVEVRDLLPINNDSIDEENATCAQISLISDGGSCFDDDITWTGLSIAAGDTIRLTYTWTLPDPVAVSTSWRNEAGVVEYRSTTTTGEEFVYVPRDNIDPAREPDANTDRARDAAQISSPGLTLTKTRTTSVDEAGNRVDDQATIGETISFRVAARQSAGTVIEDAVLTDDLTGTGMSLVPGSATAFSALVAPGAPCPDAGAAVGVEVTPPNLIVVPGPAGDLDPSDEDLCVILTFDAVVEDAPNDPDEDLVVRPNDVRNTAVVAYDADPSDDVELPREITAFVDSAIVEPNLQITKSSSAAGETVFPDATVTYTLVVTNQGDVSTAHDLVVVDDFSGASVEAVVDPGGGTVDGDMISWTVAELAPGASITLSYSVILQLPLDAGAILTNTATVTGTSLAGAIAGERTSLSACSPASCPGYIDTDSASLEVDGPRVTKDTLLGTVRTVGDVQTYVIRAILPAHLDFGDEVVTLTDDLSGGLTTFVGSSRVFCSGCTDAERAQFRTPEQNGTAASGAPRWDLAMFGSSGITRQVVVVSRARVENQPATGAGDTLTNTVTLDYVNGTLTDPAAITIAEPDVALVKEVAGPIDSTGPRETTPDDPEHAAPGLPITYHLEITNNGGWPAYDIAVLDEPDSLSSAGSCTGTSRLTPLEVTSNPGADLIDGTLGPGDGCIGWNIPVLFPDDTVTIDYQLTVPADFPRDDLIIGPEFVNVVTIPAYFGLFAGDRLGNPDVRAYPATPLVADGHVDVVGGALGDLVWLDVNGDGDRDPDEPGIPDVGIAVTSASFPLVERTTNANGIWLTDDGRVPPQWLAAGTYTVAVDTATLPGGLTPTFDATPPPDSMSSVTLAENEVRLDQDFGYTGVGSVGDVVWLDIDGDGAQDPGEPGIPGVELAVTWAGFDGVFDTADDLDYGTVTTDAAGLYGVDAVPAGPVRVTVDAATLPDGVEATFDLDGGNDSSAIRTLGAGEDATDVDFGYTGTGSVGDFVWLDLDGVGDQNPGEPGIPEVDLDATWAGFDGVLDTPDDVDYGTVTTDGDGIYTVSNLPAGPVRVTVATATLPGGLTATFDLDGDLDSTAVRELAAGEDAFDVDFGYAGEHSVGDLVWLDVDRDGSGPDSDDILEPGVPGQVVVGRWSGFDNVLDTADDIVAATTTDDEGRWGFQGVPDGLGRVTLLGGPRTQLDVSADPDGVLDGIHERTVPTADDLNIDFGLAGGASVGDVVWLDVNGDDVQDPGEPGIPGVDVSVAWAGFDGELGTDDDIEYGTVTTDASGGYLVDNVPPGPVRVTIDPATVPDGIVASFDLDGGDDETADRELGRNEAARDVDFGYVGTGSAGDFVWWDFDGDGVQDPGEPGVPGVTVTLMWPGFEGAAVGFTTTTTTGPDGSYLFELLPPGDFVVTVDVATLPAGLEITADPDGGDDSTATFTLDTGGSDLDQDFGYVGERAIGDLVWSDTDRDRTRQPSETAIGGARLTITYLGADGVAGGDDDVAFAMVTASPPTLEPATSFGSSRGGLRAMLQAAFGGVPLPGEPFYDAVGLVDGTYTVALDPATLPAGQAPFADRDGGDPALATVALAGGDLDDVDFAVFRNDPPTSEAQTGLAACGAAVEVDPFAGVTDPNGGPLTLVPGSIVAPAGVTVSVTAGGQLRIATAQSVTADYTVTWQVADDGGLRTTVTLAVDVSCIDADAGSACSADRAYFWWRADGSASQAPITLQWYDESGTLRLTTSGQPLNGSVWWPSGSWVDGGEVRITAADGATAGPFALEDPCTDGPLASTGAQILRIAVAALATLLTGAALLVWARSRRSPRPAA